MTGMLFVVILQCKRAKDNKIWLILRGLSSENDPCGCTAQGAGDSNIALDLIYAPESANHSLSLLTAALQEHRGICSLQLYLLYCYILIAAVWNNDIILDKEEIF